MKGSVAVIEMLNKVLGRELVAINQYFLHARMLDNMGLVKIGHLEYKASIDEMKHADELIKRILMLEGLPNLQKLERLRIGTNVKEILECDLTVEHEATPVLKEAIKIAEKDSDYVSRDLFVDILESEEHHIDWLETQLGLIEKVGVEKYMLAQIDMDKSASS
jgi:bacterioferritin